MFTDPLTGLPNRRHLETFLAGAVALAARHGRIAAVLSIDIDRFKAVHDRLGQEASDEALGIFAARIAKTTGDLGLPARTGADDFVVVVPQVENDWEAVALAQRLADALAAPCTIAAEEISATASVGIAFCPLDGTDAQILLKCADIAVFRAKQKGGGRAETFSSSMDRPVREAVETVVPEPVVPEPSPSPPEPVVLAPEPTVPARETIPAPEPEPEAAAAETPPPIVPAAQFRPLVCLRTGRTIGIEVSGKKEPTVFGVVLRPASSEQDLSDACRQAARWRRDLPDFPRLTIRTSASLLEDADLPAHLARILEETDLPAAAVEIALTKTPSLADDSPARATLHALHQAGIRLAADVLGLEHASLFGLRTPSLRRIAIDPTFVAGIGRDVNEENLLRALIDLAHTLGMEATGGGVETAAQRDWLASVGCDSAQGPFFGEPVGEDAVPALLDR